MKTAVIYARYSSDNQTEQLIEGQLRGCQDYVIDEIRVYEDKLEIKFNSPIKRSPDDNQGFFLFKYNSKLTIHIQNKEKPNMLDIVIKYLV